MSLMIDERLVPKGTSLISERATQFVWVALQVCWQVCRHFSVEIRVHIRANDS
jgi:hypothetical protein